MKPLRCYFLFAILLTVVSATRAQQPNAPDPKEILKQAAAACLKLKTVEYLSVQETLSASRVMFPNVGTKRLQTFWSGS